MEKKKTTGTSQRRTPILEVLNRIQITPSKIGKIVFRDTKPRPGAAIRYTLKRFEKPLVREVEKQEAIRAAVLNYLGDVYVTLNHYLPDNVKQDARERFGSVTKEK